MAGALSTLTDCLVTPQSRSLSQTAPVTAAEAERARAAAAGTSRQAAPQTPGAMRTPAAAASPQVASLPRPAPLAQPSAPLASPQAEAAIAGFSPIPTPTEVPSAIDITSLAPTVQVSDNSLTPYVNDKLGPARAASMRTVETARVQLVRGERDESIRTLGRALSIDPSNPYAYLYLGRAYFATRDPPQALTFFHRATI